MSSSTNKRIDDRVDEEERRHGKYTIDNDPSKRDRKIEREVSKRAKK